jgi:DNA-binding NtrC family response regulator
VFLDEVGELTPELQPKLLRVLERKMVKRVGANTYQPVDVRIIAATSRNLRAEVNERRFRADLYYRLAVVPVQAPPLRERREDVPLLVAHFRDQLGAGDVPALTSPDFIAHLARHAWPGNVRELRNFIERCVALGEVSAPAASGDLQVDAAAGVDLSPLRLARDRCLRRFERAYLVEMLRVCDDNVSEAARRAGVDRPSFYRLLWRHGLR